ncbi:hypothetical protein M885DRAFT_618320 [Pelagophyceae sp. CCMP2097]|nr:hypothetical protein M885DRAFT_618320 [Pelagophyceae sp. CCMP2097]
MFRTTLLVLLLRTSALALPRSGQMSQSHRRVLSPAGATAALQPALGARRSVVACAAALHGGATKPKPSLKALWGVVGVMAMLLNAVKRVAPLAAEPFAAAAGTFGALRWTYYVGFAVVMGTSTLEPVERAPNEHSLPPGGF